MIALNFIPPIGGTGFGGGSGLNVLLGFKNKRDLKIYTPDLRNECCGGTRCNVWCRGAAVAVAETEAEAEAEAKAEAESEVSKRKRTLFFKDLNCFHLSPNKTGWAQKCFQTTPTKFSPQADFKHSWHTTTTQQHWWLLFGCKIYLHWYLCSPPFCVPPLCYHDSPARSAAIGL
jgi:hypothetical protein